MHRELISVAYLLLKQTSIVLDCAEYGVLARTHLFLTAAHISKCVHDLSQQGSSKQSQANAAV